MPTDVLDDRQAQARLDRGGPESRCGSPSGDGRPDEGPPGILGDPVRFAIWAFMGTVTMLFVGFTSAYILRRASPDWRPLSAPGILWVNTLVLLSSSGTLEAARKRLRGWDLGGSWVEVTGLLGLLFMAGQVAAWRQLAAQGVYLSTNPHSSFFYLLTGVHMLHLLGGLAWFGVVLARVRRMAYAPGEDGLGPFATYWHFLTGLWLYLLFLLFVL